MHRRFPRRDCRPLAYYGCRSWRIVFRLRPSHFGWSCKRQASNFTGSQQDFQEVLRGEIDDLPRNWADAASRQLQGPGTPACAEKHTHRSKGLGVAKSKNIESLRPQHNNLRFEISAASCMWISKVRKGCFDLRQVQEPNDAHTWNMKLKQLRTQQTGSQSFRTKTWLQNLYTSEQQIC